MSYSNWQKERIHLNHDWLKNRFIQALGKLLHVLDGRILEESYPSDFLKYWPIAWETKHINLHSLLDDFSTEMSPISILKSFCLTDLTEEEKQRLFHITDTLWKRRCHVDLLQETAKVALEELNVEFVLLCKALSTDWTPEHNVNAKEYARKTYEASRKLSEAITQFPSDIIVTNRK